MAYEMHFIFPTIYRLDIHLPEMQNVTWNENAAETMNDIIEQAATKDTTLTVWFKANRNFEKARNFYYQDFSTKFIYSKAKRMWTPQKQGFSIGHIYYVSSKANDSESFYLHLLLIAVKSAISFEA